MNHFSDCKTPEEAKSRYKKLAKELHPDMKDGSTEAFQEMEKQYREFITQSLNEKMNEFENKKQYADYLFDFLKDNPQLMESALKSILLSKSIRKFINKNADLINTGIGIFNMFNK